MLVAFMFGVKAGYTKKFIFFWLKTGLFIILFLMLLKAADLDFHFSKIIQLKYNYKEGVM